MWHGRRQRDGGLGKNPRRDTILEDLGLEPESKSLGCPALGADKMDEAGDEEELPKEGVRHFLVGSCKVELRGHGPPRHPVRL